MVGFDLRNKAISILILTLRGIKGVGSKTIRLLLNQHKQEIEHSSKLDESLILSFGYGRLNRKNLQETNNWAESEALAVSAMDQAQRIGVHVLNPYMREYPQRLLRNESYPPLLFCKGNVEALNTAKAAAIVGARHPTEYGQRFDRRLASVLAQDGYAIISGLALGCDTLAHEGALDVHGLTVALVPTPIDAPVYPRSNQGLAERIVHNRGALVSEYAPGDSVSGRQLVSNLIARDEWQAGMSDGVIAVETSIDGGTNYALKHALQTNTPIAVADYSKREHAHFYEDKRFSGNVEYLRTKRATPLFDLDTIEQFEKLMDAYRERPFELPWGNLPDRDTAKQLRMGFR